MAHIPPFWVCFFLLRNRNTAQEGGFFQGAIKNRFWTRVIKSYKECRLDECARCLIESNNLYQKYIAERTSDKIDPDDFRRSYDEELDGIENRFYSIDDEAISTLSKYIETNLVI